MVVQFLLILALINTEQKSPFTTFQWQYRIIVIDQQMVSSDLQVKQLMEKKEELKDRDLLVFLKQGTKLICQNADQIELEDPGNQYSGISLIGKDGGLKLQKGSLVDAQLIFDLIDSMPMRQSEMRRKSH